MKQKGPKQRCLGITYGDEKIYTGTNKGFFIDYYKGSFFNKPGWKPHSKLEPPVEPVCCMRFDSALPEESGPCLGPWGPGTVAEGQAVLQRFMVGKTQQDLYDLPPWEMLWGQGRSFPINRWFRKSIENGWFKNMKRFYIF